LCLSLVRIFEQGTETFFHLIFLDSKLNLLKFNLTTKFFVIVRTVLGSNYDPILARHLTAMQWVILERVGRARHQVNTKKVKKIWLKSWVALCIQLQGEMTHGKLSLNFTKETPKTLFYHRKVLVSKNLLCKQVIFLGLFYWCVLKLFQSK